MSLSLSTAPTLEPVTLAEAKGHLRLDADDSTEDAYLTALIAAARHQVEAHTSRALLNQTWAWKLDDFPHCDQIRVPKAPLSSVTSITYIDTAGTTQTWAASNYDVDAPDGPRAQMGTISLAFEKAYPVVRSDRNAVTITFVAGYGAAATAVPQDVRQAALLLIAEMYERREEGLIGTIQTEVPLSVSRILSSYVSGGWD